MVDITPAVPAGRQVINGYGDGGFRIAGERHDGPVIVFPDRTVPWDPGAGGALTLASFAPLIEVADSVDVLLVGTGRAMVFLEPEVREGLRAHRIVADAMDTGAACRTFNVLLGEDRRVAAALLPIG